MSESTNIKYSGLNFGRALQAVKLGAKACRKGWNGNKPPKIPSKPIYNPVGRFETIGEYTFITSSKGSVAVIDSDCIPLLNGIEKFTEGSGGYLTHTDNKSKINTRLHQMLIPTKGDLVVDHINGDILDNRLINLRLATKQQNSYNRKPKNKYKGVTYDATRNKFNAAIQVDGKSINLGRYECEIDAAKAYDQRAIIEHGEYAYLNFDNDYPDMFIFLVPSSTFSVSRAPLLGIYPEGTEINYHAHVDMRTADGTIVPWLCSQTDMLAEDWCVIS